MTAIHPETEIIETRSNPATHVHTYVIAREGKRWTVDIPDDEFRQFGPVIGASHVQNKQARRTYLARRLVAAMEGPKDAQ